MQSELFWDSTTVSKTVASDSATPVIGFDTLYFEAPSDNTGFAVDNVIVSTGTVPEPSSAMLLLFGGLAVLTRCPRRNATSG